MKKKSRKKKLVSRKFNSTVLLFTNGKTEEIYFKAFQRSESKSGLVVKPIFTNGEMISFVNGVKSKLRDPEIRKYYSSADKIFFVFDYDAHSNEEVTKTFAELRRVVGDKARIYFSNFSFELWLLSHSKKVTGFTTQNELQTALEEIYNIERGKWNSHKTDEKLISKIVVNWKQAIEHCTHFEEDLYSNWSTNPWTNVNQLFSEL